MAPPATLEAKIRLTTIALLLLLLLPACAITSQEAETMLITHPWTLLLRDAQVRQDCRTVLAGGAPVQLRFLSLEGDSAAPLLVFLHGTPGGKEVWAQCMTARRSDGGKIPFDLRANFALIAPDLPGHGITGGECDPVSFASIAEIVTEFLQTFGDRRIVLVGHSYGGEIAWRVAASYKKLAGLVLIDASGFPRRKVHFSEGDRSSLGALASFGLTWGLEVMGVSSKDIAADLAVGAYMNPSVMAGNNAVSAYETYLKVCDNTQASLLLTREEIHVDDELATIQALRTITCPTLLIYGTEDPWYTVCEQGARFWTCIPSSRLWGIADARHNVHEEYPERICQCLFAWWGLVKESPTPAWLVSYGPTTWGAYSK